MNSDAPKKAIIKLKDTKNGSPIILTTGEYAKVGNSYNISFNYDNADFLIGLSDEVFSISRTGEESYTLLLEKDKEHEMEIATKFGSLSYSVVPKELRYKVLRNGIDAAIKYVLNDPEGSIDINMFISCKDEN